MEEQITIYPDDIVLRKHGTAYVYSRKELEGLSRELDEILHSNRDALESSGIDLGKLYAAVDKLYTETFVSFEPDISLGHDAIVTFISGINSLGAQPVTGVEIAKEELATLAEDPQNWQQRLAALLQKHKRKNPVVAGILSFLAKLLITFLLTQALGTAKTSCTAALRQAPNTKAAQITRLDAGRQGVVLAQRPYYYQLRLEDTATGETLTGWVAKRCVTIQKLAGEGPRHE